MRKAIAAIVIVLLVGAGAFFGVAYWARQAAAREVDALLDQLRAGLGPVTRGDVDVDLWTRTVTVADVVAQSPSDGQRRIAAARVVASGIDMAGKVDRIEITDLEVSDSVLGNPGARMQQKAGKVTLTEFWTRPLPPGKVPNTSLDQARLWLEQFSAITAALIEIPSLTITVTPTSGMGPAEYTYSNLVLRGVHAGRVAELRTDGIVFHSIVQGPMREIHGEIGTSSISDADMGPVLAVLDPARPQATGFQSIYRRMTMGPYKLRFGDGTSISIDSMAAEDIGLQPAKLSLDDLAFLKDVADAADGAAPGVGQMAMLMDKVAGLYEAFHLGRLDIKGVSIERGRSGGAQIAGIRIDRLENGRLGELAFDGFKAAPPIGDAFELGRVSIKGFDISGLMRLAATQPARPARGGARRPPASPEEIAAMLRLLEGVELENVVVPDPRTRRVARVESFRASWGQLVGGIPSQSRLSLKLSAPIRAPDPEPFINLLASAGMQALVAGVDVGAAWSEADQSVILAPATVEIDGVLALSVKASAANVSRDLFSTDILKAMGSAASVEVGAIEVTLRDLGLLDLVAGEIARPSGQGPEAGRSLLLKTWEMQAMQQPDPAAQPFFQAMRQFVTGKGETLTVRLIPKGRVRMLELAEALRLDPAGALLAGFTVEAASGR